MNTQIEIKENGTTTLATAGKYCDRNIDVNVEVSGDSHYDAFWDVYQKQGERTDYENAFQGEGWSDANFKPKYDIIPTGTCSTIFRKTNIVDLKACLESSGAKLDFSKATTTSNLFAHSYSLAIVPKIDLASATANTYTFYRCESLHTIEELVISEKTVFNSSFYLCAALEHLTMTGTLAQNGFDVHWSAKLSKASIESIINALSSTTSGLTVMISKAAKEAAFTSAEWSELIATKSNWTISLA